MREDMSRRDMLEDIFEKQRLFIVDLEKRRNLPQFSMEQWIQMETLAMMSELSELIDEVNFKWWKNPKPVDAGRVRDELVDILHFFVSMCIKSGMSAEELHSRYMEKNRENFNRQRGLSEKPGYAPEENV